MVKCSEFYPSTRLSGVPIKKDVGCISIEKKKQEFLFVHEWTCVFIYFTSKFIKRKYFKKNFVHEVKEKDDYCSAAERGLGSVNIGIFVS